MPCRDFLDRNRELLVGNRRMWMQMKNLGRIEPAELDLIRDRASLTRSPWSRFADSFRSGQSVTQRREPRTLECNRPWILHRWL